MTRYYHNSNPNSRLSSACTSFFRTFIILSVVTIASIITSCEEDPTTIGKVFFPGSDFVSVKSTDTLSIFGFSRYESPVRSDNGYFSHIGTLTDPYLGETTSDFVAQLRLMAPWTGGGVPVIDTVMFVMTIDAVEGSVTTPQYVILSEATDLLNVDSVYYSDKVVHEGRNFGTYLMPVITHDTTIAIQLPVSVGEYLMRDTLMLFHSNDEPDFTSFFRGLHVRLADSPDPAFFTTDLSAGTTGITLKYHNKLGTNLVYSFVITENSALFNRYTHDLSKAVPDKKIKYLNQRVKDSVTFVQNQQGVFTQIEIPGLKELKSLMPVSVNKARLTFPIYFDNDTYKHTTLPSQILLRYKTAEGTTDTVPDFFLGLDFLGGAADSTTVAYTFNIASFTQLYLEGKIPDPVLELFLPEGTIHNVMLRMNDNSNPAKMEFTYTKF